MAKSTAVRGGEGRARKLVRLPRAFSKVIARLKDMPVDEVTELTEATHHAHRDGAGRQVAAALRVRMLQERLSKLQEEPAPVKVKLLEAEAEPAPDIEEAPEALEVDVIEAEIVENLPISTIEVPRDPVVITLAADDPED